MKNLIITTLLITFFFSSCSNNDDSISQDPEELIADCKVIGTDGRKDLNPLDIVIPIIDNDSNTFNNQVPQQVFSEQDLYDSETYNNAEIVFLTQYEYDSENKLTERYQYEQTYYVDTDIKDSDNITYDASNRIVEISTFFYELNTTFLKVFEYDNSETLPVKSTRYRINENEDSLSLSYTEDFTYNNTGQLIKVSRNFRGGSKQNLTETTYEYNVNGNLTKIEAVSSGEYDNWTSTETFENYDNERNPFKDLPFSDLRGISESNNNYTKYSKEFFSSPNSGAVLELPSSPSSVEISGYEFEPTESYYSRLAKYQCEE